MEQDKPDIEQLFKSNERKLNERPPEAIWDRLEGRLDKTNPTKTRSINRNYVRFGSIAACLALFAWITIQVNDFDGKNQSVATASETSTPEQPVFADQSAVIAAVRKEAEAMHVVYKTETTNPRTIEGGTLSTVVIEAVNPLGESLPGLNSEYVLAENEPVSEQEVAEEAQFDVINDDYIAMNDEIADEANKSVRTTTVAPLPAPSKQDMSSTLAKDILDREPPAVETVEMTNVPNKETTVVRAGTIEEGVAYDEMGTIDLDHVGVASNHMDLEETKPAATRSTAVQPAIASKPAASEGLSSKKRLKRKQRQAEKRERKRRDAASKAGDSNVGASSSKGYENESAVADAKYVTTNELKRFDWLIGEWNDITSPNSFESWTQVDEYTLVGVGSIVSNGDTTFVERMELRQLDNKVVLITTVNDKASPIQYQLTSYDGKAAVFSNSKVDFPREMVLTKTSKDNFSTVLQNRSAAKVSSSQQQYLMNRNFINEEKAVRNMVRQKGR